MKSRVLAIFNSVATLFTLVSFITLDKIMIINTCNENYVSDTIICKDSNVSNIDGGFTNNLRSGSSEIQSFKLLCLFKGHN